MNNRIFAAIGFLALTLGQLPASYARQAVKDEVGVILPLTGNLGFVGEQFRNGLTLAKETSTTTLEFVFEDSKGLAKDGVGVFVKFAERKGVKAVVAALSSVANSVLPLSGRYQMPLIASVTSKSAFPVSSRWASRYFLSSEDEVSSMLGYMSEQKVTELAVLYVNDEFGLDAMNLVKREFKGKIVAQDSYAPTETDFKTILGKFEPAKLKAIYIVGYGQLYGVAVKQLAEMGYKGRIFAFSSFGSPVVLKAAGESAKGVVFTNTEFQPAADLLSAEGKAFVASYSARFNKLPDHYAGYAYELGKLLVKTAADAHKAAAGDISRTAFRNALGSVKEASGIFGRTTQDKSRDFHFKVYLYQVTAEGKIKKL